MYKALAILCLLGAVCAEDGLAYVDDVHGMEPGKIPRHLGLDATINEYCSVEEPNCGKSDIDINIGPDYVSGDILDSTKLMDIDDALGDVLNSGGLTGNNRRVAVGVANYGPSKLTNPRYYLFCGETGGPMAPEINKGETGLSLFQKITSALRGTIGVLSYDIEGTDKKLAVLWSIPHDFNLYKPMFNFKVYPQSFATDKDMYEQMYYNAGAFSCRGGNEKREEFGTVVEATMNEDTKAKLTVWIDTKNFDENGSPELWTDCKYHPGWVAHFCTQEKYPEGWCWADKVRCKNGVSDCQNGPYSCR